MAKTKTSPTETKLIKARKELRDARLELKQQLNEQQKSKNIINYYESYEPRKIIRVPLIKYASPKAEHGVVIAGLSDIHGEEKITYETTNGHNRLTPSITEDRIKFYGNNLIKLHKLFSKDITLDKLVWFWGGDMIHGFIHDEYLRTNYLTPIEAGLWMTNVLRGLLEFVLENGDFNEIIIVCKIGNHSRITKKIFTDEEAKHSYEWGIYQTLAREFPQLTWMIEENYLTYLSVYNKVLRFHHGHAFRYMGGIGGITIPLVRYISKLNRQKRADMDIMGHWHTRTFDATDGFLVNGSVCGPSPYSIRLGFPIEDPTQFFQILDQKRGFTINAPILVKQ